MSRIWGASLFLISVAATNVYGAPLIREAFGVQLGSPVEVRRLKSKAFQSETYIGSLHHYFRPKHAHPMLDEYSLWVTPKSRTVIAIRGLGGYTFKMGTKYENWNPDRNSKFQSGRDECRRNRDRVAQQISGRYGLSQRQTKDGRLYTWGGSRYRYVWYTYTDGYNHIRLGCTDIDDGDDVSIVLEVYYEMGKKKYQALLRSEAAQLDDARGL